MDIHFSSRKKQEERNVVGLSSAQLQYEGSQNKT